MRPLPIERASKTDILTVSAVYQQCYCTILRSNDDMSSKPSSWHAVALLCFYLDHRFRPPTEIAACVAGFKLKAKTQTKQYNTDNIVQREEK